MLLQIVAGALYSLSFKPVGVWIFAPASFAVQFYLLRRFRYPEIQSFLFAFSASLIILNWSKTYVGAVPWVALALLQGLLALPIGLVARYTSKIPFLIFATLIMEEVRARFPFGGFSWTRIAFSQIDSPFSPLVSKIGVVGLSLITLILAGMALQPRARYLILLLLIFAGSIFWANPIDQNPTIRIRAIQGGVPQRGLEFNARAQAVLDNHIAMTLQEFDGSEGVILWPENSIDIDPIRNREVAQKLKNLSVQMQVPLIAGAILDSKELNNATIYFDSQGEVRSTYLKRYLTPFGEYIPLRSVARVFSSHVDRVSDFSPGKKLVLHQLPEATIASVICYELLSDRIVRDSALDSDFLVVHTNSATFAGSSEGEQQLAITRLRAMESGKSVVSISTTGPSAVISARGEVLAKINDGEQGSLLADIPLRKSTTFFYSLGGYGTPFVLLFALIWVILSARVSTPGRRLR